MEGEVRRSEKLSAAIDVLNQGVRPSAAGEAGELARIAMLLKAADPPPAMVAALAARVAGELAARRRHCRLWYAAGTAGTVAAALLAVALNLPPPASSPPATPLVIPPAGSMVVEPIPAGEKTLFVSDKFAGWEWYKDAYPRDMAFAAVTGPGGGSAVPAAVLARAGDIDYSRKLLVAAYLGTGGGADAIGIERVSVSGSDMTVRVRTRSIRPGQAETLNVTNPADFVAIDRSRAGDVQRVIFVDQKGAVLATAALELKTP